MLFSYIYVPHPLDQLHRWMEHLMLNVWCRNGGRWAVTLLCQELQDIHAKITTRKPTIFTDIKKIDARIQALKQSKRDELARMFRDSTAVDALCQGSGSHCPYDFTDLKAWDPVLATTLRKFFDDLFDKHIEYGPIKQKLGDLKDHVDRFTATNKPGKCPFCGLTDMRGTNYTTRDDYDHYLPRSKYPFNSVNFRNLAPMCSTCNKSYKTTKNPISKKRGTRQKAYAPFQAGVTFPNIGIGLNPSRIQLLQKDDIRMMISSPTHQAEVDTWQWLFGIQERYKGKLCSEQGAYSWLTVVRESTSHGIDPQAMLNLIRANAAKYPFIEDGFLKVPTLAACEAAGLL